MTLHLTRMAVLSGPNDPALDPNGSAICSLREASRLLDAGVYRALRQRARYTEWKIACFNFLTVAPRRGRPDAIAPRKGRGAGPGPTPTGGARVSKYFRAPNGQHLRLRGGGGT